MKHRHFWDRFFRYTFFMAAIVTVAVLVGILGMLLVNGGRMFEQVSIREFLTGTRWNPSAYQKATYGILPMLVSTGLVTLGAMLLAVPLGIGTAAWLSEVAPKRVAAIVKPIIELLSAVPSVTIGFLGIVLIGPLLARLFGLYSGLNALNGSVLLAIMALPTIVTVAEEAIRAVPQRYKEASSALGATRWTTLISVTLPACYSGILAAVMLGVGRAVGETMTVLMATGNSSAMPGGFLSPVRTLTATIAIELGEVPYGTTHYYSLFAIGAVLFLITLFVNWLAERIAANYRRMGQ